MLPNGRILVSARFNQAVDHLFSDSGVRAVTASQRGERVGLPSDATQGVALERLKFGQERVRISSKNVFGLAGDDDQVIRPVAHFSHSLAQKAYGSFV